MVIFFFIFKEHAHVANLISYERCSRPLNETFIWYSWVIWSYIHQGGLEISIKTSRRYHGNHQEKSMSIDEAPCEAFNLMHMLELTIDGHIKLNKEFFFVKYINEIYNTNVSVPVASVKDSHDNYNINTHNDMIYQYLSLPWHALYYITISYERTCIMCMWSSTTCNLNVCAHICVQGQAVLNCNKEQQNMIHVHGSWNEFEAGKELSACVWSKEQDSMHQR